VSQINAPDGTPLVYDAYEPARPDVAVLLLHDWHPQADSLTGIYEEFGNELKAAGVATYVLEQRGHGRSGGQRGHLSRFSQLLGDLQALRRAVRRRHDVPQVLAGHGFGGLVVLRYLETQPGEAPIAAVISSPWLATRARASAWKRLAARLADLWPRLPTGRSAAFMTAGARAELQWARRAVLADYQRIERPVLLLLGGADQLTDLAVARRFAGDLGARATLHWYPELSYDLLATPQIRAPLLKFIAEHRSLDLAPKKD
jgi:alpha-beta hydrolase superfamily lysophospholipase